LYSFLLSAPKGGEEKKAESVIMRIAAGNRSVLTG
jgi:hypothetical protein